MSWPLADAFRPSSQTTIAPPAPSEIDAGQNPCVVSDKFDDEHPGKAVLAEGRNIPPEG
jgi:hypothetical protein